MRTRRGFVAALAALLAAATFASPVAAQQDDGFGDVPDDAYYSVPVAELAQRGVFLGTLCDEGFCPGAAIDRKTMAVWVVRVLDGQEPPAVTETRFADIDADSFYAPFVERMAELGVATGCGDGTNFCPERSTTRAEMATFLHRAYDLPDGADPGFSDVSADAWYAAYVAKLAASGITTGCGDGTNFCPERSTTRAEMATFLHRAEARDPVDEPELGQPDDCIATPTSVSAAGLDRTEVLDYFLEVALGTEFGGSSRVIRKWETDLAIQVHGAPTTEDRETLGQVIAELNDIMVSPRLRLVESSPNVDIHFAPISRFPSIEPNYVPGNSGFFWMWWRSFSLFKARILIATDVDRQARAHLIREELTQALGLANDSYKYPDSIFYQRWSETTEYSDIDRTIIGILYRDDVAPGMDRADLQEVRNLPFCSRSSG